jgi:hypothetical protein
MKPGPNGGKLAILITGAELPGKTADRVDADKPTIDSDLAAARVVASVLSYFTEWFPVRAPTPESI